MHPLEKHGGVLIFVKNMDLSSRRRVEVDGSTNTDVARTRVGSRFG